MFSIKNKWIAFAGLVTILSLSWSTADAWEFSMSGSFSTTYEYYSEQGTDGFFGRHNVDGSTGVGGLAPGDYASLNAWVGAQVEHLVSGSDASRQYFNLDLAPQFRLNKALRFRGTYRLGDYGDPDASDYIANTRPGTDVATSDGQWTMWWLTAQTPWGIIAVGKRPMTWGCGLQYNGESNVTTEGVALVSSYGPFRFSYGFRPYFQQPPNPRIGRADFPYYNIFDKNGVRSLANRVFLTYRNGPADMGIIYAWLKWHAGPESQASQADRLAFVPYDEELSHGSAYVKYSNGRFFLNAETAYLERWTRRTGATPQYAESWRYLTELGAYIGPAKLSLLWTFMPGPDRRAGRRIDRQPFHQMPPFGSFDVHRPYSYLLGYAYGGGVNAFNLNGNGYINDATVLAARLDYAVAANLNVFVSGLWAQRASHGYGWGYIRPTQEAEAVLAVAGGVPVLDVEYTPAVAYRPNGGPNPAPSIPDLDLGWELGAGLDWALLEQFTFHAGVAYWLPGDWFKYACIDRNVPGWDVPVPGNNWGADPDRNLDAVLGLEVAISADF
jgi:hypothetical protein